MYFLWKNHTESNESSPLIIIFGSGLIGSSIIRSINSNAKYSSFSSRMIQFPWLEASHQTRLLDSVQKDMLEQLSTTDNVEVVWSAGRAGFECNKVDAETELSNYIAVINWLDQIQTIHNINITVNLISSLGGLFERTETVTKKTKPEPIRAYGHLKLAQEHQLISRKNLNWRIYRVSSAYGMVSNSHRMGLIPTLIANGIRQESIFLSGSLETLRDYIWVDDVANYVVNNLTSSDSSAKIKAIASYRSHSIQEIIDKVERVINKQLRLTHNDYLTNARSISICPSLRPPDLVTSDLDQTLRTIANLEIKS